MPRDRFAQRLVTDNANVNKRRSFLPYMKHSVKTDFNPGLLVPLDLWSIIPGDTVSTRHALKIRMTNPPKVPTMDQLVADLYWFYVPFRIINDKWDDLITANNGTRWDRIPEYATPQMIFDTNVLSSLPADYSNSDFGLGSVFDFLGMTPFLVQTQQATFSFNYMPLTAYIRIWNDYFRYEPLQDEILIHTDGNDLTITSDEILGFANYESYYNRNYIGYMRYARSHGELFGGLLPTNKKDGFFERALPQPQRGPEVALLGFENAVLGNVDVDSNSVLSLFGDDLTEDPLVGSIPNGESLPAVNINGVYVNGIGGGLTGITGNSINDLRKAFAVQSVLDIDARFGSRINEWTVGMFGVNVPDSRIDFPECLGHSTIYLNMQQVVQSSASTEDSKQGNTGAWSETTHKGFDFVKSFCEFGYVIPVITVRVLNHSYGSMIEKAWLKKTRFDFYMPPLANISDQPIPVEMLAGEAPGNPNVFGYQEAWADDKYMPSKISHMMRPQVNNGANLSVWHYGESYVSEDFYLNEQFIIEDWDNIARTVYVTPSNTESMFIIDMYMDCDFVRIMPLHSLPGGLTHSW